MKNNQDWIIEMGEKMAFPKLNGSNYDNWSFRMKLSLIKKRNWTAAANVEPKSVTSQWTTKDEQALAST